MKKSILSDEARTMGGMCMKVLSRSRIATAKKERLTLHLCLLTTGSLALQLPAVFFFALILRHHSFGVLFFAAFNFGAFWGLNRKNGACKRSGEFAPPPQGTSPFAPAKRARRT